MATARAIFRWTMIVALVSLSRAQTIDLRGYQLNSVAVGLIPVFDHDFRGAIRCGNAKAANAVVDLVRLRANTHAGSPGLPSLHAVSDERGSFRVWVPEGDWMLIVRTTCEKPMSPFSQTLLRVGHRIHVSYELSKDSTRVLSVEMQTGEMGVVGNGEPEVEIGMDGRNGNGPIY